MYPLLTYHVYGKLFCNIPKFIVDSDLVAILQSIVDILKPLQQTLHLISIIHYAVYYYNIIEKNMFENL